MDCFVTVHDKASNEVEAGKDYVQGEEGVVVPEGLYCSGDKGCGNA